MQTSPPCVYRISRACECGRPLYIALSARVTAEASKREQNLTGSEWVLSSDDQWPVGNLENPNCVLSEPATAGAIIHSLLNLSPSVCTVLCVHASVPMPVCVSVRPFPSWKPSEPQGAVKNQYSSAALPLYSFNNSLPLHYCSTDLPSQGPDWHLCALLPHWSLM